MQGKWITGQNNGILVLGTTPFRLVHPEKRVIEITVFGSEE